ncbi:carbon-nitrogen hydrolase family protein [Candidatus Woesearchaeota archaeon]|nr:carbon-nitrogen hydrolase family protein [Candidatus Woesearchaeota archaeon]
MKIKIAVVQFDIRQFSPEENLKRAEVFISKAALAKAHIIVFPEDFLTGPIERRRELADGNNTYRKHFQNLARQYKIDIVPGSFIELDQKGLHNTTYYIDATGKVKARYRKINLWLPERRYITPGNEVPVFNTSYGKIGLVICWDLIFPEIFRKMVKRGVSIVICPSYWCMKDAGIGIKHDKRAEIKSVDSLCTARAFENEIILVYCNAAGKLKLGNFEDDLIGCSQITAPFKGILQRLNHNKEAMFLQEVDTALLQDAERAYKIRKDLKTRVLS